MAWWAFIRHGPTPTNTVRRARTARSARAASQLPRESTGWRVQAAGAHANAGCSLEVAAGTSEHGRAPREGGCLDDVMGFHEAWSDSNQRGAVRTCRKRVCCVTARVRACDGTFARVHICASKPLVGGCGWHVRARSCTEGDGRLSGVVGFRGPWTDSNQRGAVRARHKRAWCASF